MANDLMTNDELNGATIGSRTRDLILTMDALYRLSYRGQEMRENRSERNRVPMDRDEIERG